MGTTQQGTSEKQLQSFLKVIERPVFSYNYQDGTLWSAPAYIIYNEFHDHWLAARAVSYKKAYTGPDSVWEVMDPEYGTVQLMMVPDLKKLIRASGNKKTFLIAVWD